MKVFAGISFMLCFSIGTAAYYRYRERPLHKIDDSKNRSLTPGSWKSERKFVEDTTCPE